LYNGADKQFSDEKNKTEKMCIKFVTGAAEIVFYNCAIFAG